MYIIGFQLLKFSTAKTAWDFQVNSYMHYNHSKMYLQIQMQAVLQGEFSIQDIYTKLSILWDQVALMEHIELQANPAYIIYRKSII